jgi:hypothetical protein
MGGSFAEVGFSFNETPESRIMHTLDAFTHNKDT